RSPRQPVRSPSVSVRVGSVLPVRRPSVARWHIGVRAAVHAYSVWLTAGIGTVPRLVLAFKAIAGMASLTALAVVVSVVRRVAPDRVSFAAVVMAWNPVDLFNGVSR